MYKILQQDYYQSISSSLKSKFYTAANENHNYQVQEFQNDPWEINSKKTEPLQVNGLETDGKKPWKWHVLPKPMWRHSTVGHMTTLHQTELV